jgi:hypothetical protein
MADRFGSRIAPAVTLMLLAPLIAEVLPGATRFSSIFVFPIEMCVWGGGAVLIREVVRRAGLGWRNMLLLGLALAVAEEWLIQQTSLAPMVIALKGEVYARGYGINYVYFLWALAYESVFVVLLPVMLAEMIFPARRAQGWLNRTGLAVLPVLFAIGALLAWYSWTRVARPMVFHMPLFTPSAGQVALALAAIALLVLVALGPWRRRLARPSAPRPPAPPVAIGVAGAVWAILWYALLVLAFGLRPDFPPAVAVGAGIVLNAIVLALLPGMIAHPRWRGAHSYALALGTLSGSMAVSFVGFIGSAPADLAFKVVVDLIAWGALLACGLRLIANADYVSPALGKDAAVPA